MGNLTNSERLISKIESIQGDGTLKRYLTEQPSSPVAGDVYYNLTNNILKIYDGTQRQDFVSGGGGGGGGGGGLGYIDALIVGGGGGGGSGRGDSRGCGSGKGGGAGGVVYLQCYPVIKDIYEVCVGDGSNTTSYCQAPKGGDTIFGQYIACGGGGGAGGGCYYGSYASGGGSGGSPDGSYVVGQGYSPTAQGGGGAGGAATSLGGGAGVCYDISGSMQRYAAGGGSGGDKSTLGYCGGQGGGGAGGMGQGCGSENCDHNGKAPTTYGSGGGGGGRSTGYGAYEGPGAKGCQGVVIIRYKKDGSSGLSQGFGGCVYCCGDYIIHCFTKLGYNEFIPVFSNKQ